MIWNKRNRKFIFSLIFMTVFLVSFINLPEINLYFDSPSSDKTESLEIIGGEPGVIKIYTATGDFIPGWELIEGSLYSIQDHIGDLDIKWQGIGVHGIIERDVSDISTNTLMNYSFSYYQQNNLAFNMSAYFSDGSSQIISYTSSMGTYNPEGTFTPDKILDSIRIDGWVTAGSVPVTVSLHYEIYSGFLPEIRDWKIFNNTHIDIDDVHTFYATFNHSTLNQVIFEYATTGNEDFLTLTEDWTTDGAFYGEYTFPRPGLYYYYYICTNGWDCVNNTNKYYLTVMEDPYPHTSYLSLFSSIDGFPLESKDFKIYTGIDEEIELINFRTFYGNWTQIKGTSTVTAYLIDNYIQFNTTANGLASDFEDSGIYDTNYWNTILFEVKVFQETYLDIIYNPDYLEKDYYLFFNDSQKFYWYSVILPIFNMTFYRDVTHNNLYELGFHIDTGTIQLANIRLAHYYDALFQIDRYNYSTLYNNSASLSLSQDWNNYSKFSNETYFDYSQVQKQNTTVVSNDTVQLQLSGNYIGTYSFTNDTIGENPSSGWYVNENNEDDVQIVNFNYHAKVLRMNQSNGNLAYTPFFSGQSSGSVEFYIYTNDESQASVVELYDGNMAHALVFGIYTGKFIYVSASQPAGAQIPGTTAANAFVWYRIRITFDCTSGWYVNINGVNYSTILDYLGSPSALDRLVIWDYTFGNDLYTYYDAIDFSWSEGYFLNRNWNNTYCTNGSYISKAYNLGNTTETHEYYFQNINWTREINLNTNSSLQYRTSDDNITWSSWSGPFFTNTTINQNESKYFQFCLNLTTWGNWTYTPKILEVNLTYILKNSYFILNNYTANVTFSYNSSYYVYDVGIYNVSMNLTVYNQSSYQNFLYNYSIEVYQVITPQNYTNEILNSTLYNDTEFRIRFFLNSTIDYLFRFDLILNFSYYEDWNNTYYTANSYRLISQENRMNPDELIFDSENETIAILDYYNNVLYRAVHTWESFIDIALPIVTLTLTNNHNFTIWITINRGLGTNLSILIPGESSYSIRIFITSYYVEVRNANAILLNVTQFSPNRSKTVTIEFGDRQGFRIPTFWDMLFSSPTGILFFVIVFIALAVTFSNYIFKIINWSRKRKEKRKSKKLQRVSRTYKALSEESYVGS